MKRNNYLLSIVLTVLFTLSFSASFACQYSVTLYDDYGDGWNGGSLNVLLNGTAVLTNLTLNDGYGPETFFFDVSNGDVITTIHTDGYYPEENYYYVYNSSDIEIFSDGLNGTNPVGGAVGTGLCPDHDLAIRKWVSPALGCNLSTNPVTILITNNGNNVETSFSASYSIDNGNTFITEAINTSLSPGDTLLHTFATPASFGIYGSFNCIAFVFLASDQYSPNDTLDGISIYNGPVISSYPYVQDFESVNHYWHTGGVNSSWALGTPAGNTIISAASGTNAWLTNLSNPYSINEASYVESPCFDFSSLQNPHLSFNFFCETSAGNDGVIVQYSTDGIEWMQLGYTGNPGNWYNDWWINALLPYGSGEGWAGNFGSWVYCFNGLEFLAGQPSVKFRIFFASDQYSDSYDGFAFDDFTVYQPPFMGFASANVQQNNTSGVGQGATNVEILSMIIEANGSTAPINATDFYINAGGMKAVSDISNARLFYTANNATFGDGWQVGATATPASQFSFNDTIPLLEGLNYFWLTYDVLATAIPGNTLDAAVDSIRVDDTTRIPNNQNPSGNRIILEAMAGTYIIDSAGNGDYQSFNAAVADLILRGVKDSVQFLVKLGHYNEQVSIPFILGSSASNTIRFTSFSGDSTSVILQYAITSYSSNYILQLNGADYITFDHITMKALESSAKSVGSHIIDIRNGANYNRFMYNLLIGLVYGSSSTDYALIYSDSYNDNYNHYLHNTLLNGSYSFYLLGSSYGGLEVGTVIAHNLMKNFYYSALTIYYQNTIVVSFNTMINYYGASTSYVLKTYYLEGLNQITSNIINAFATNYLYGIYVYYWTNPAKSNSLIANNSISLTSSGTYTGRGIIISGTSNILVAHNSTNCHFDNTSSSCLQLTGGSGNSVLNNIFNNTGTGYAIYYSDTNDVSVSDYNVLLSKGSRIGNYFGYLYSHIQDLQTTGYETHSKEQDPGYTSSTDLHTFEASINGMGTPLTEVPTDIDGQLRSTTNPDPGAYEFVPPPYEAKLVRVINPTSSCGLGAETIQLEIQNMGTSTIKTGFSASYSVNGATPVTSSITGLYQPGAIFSFSFPGTYDFSAPVGDTMFNLRTWITLNGDPKPSNDSIFEQIHSRYQPSPPTTSNDVVSFGQQASLSASSIYPASWYKTMISPNILHRGDTFTTPVLYDTTDFYAAVTGPGPDLKITEIVNAYNYSGATSPYPSFLPTGDFDAIEITNLGSATAYLENYAMQMVGDINLAWQLPQGAILEPGEILILIHYSYYAAIDDPANNVYVMSNSLSSGAYNDIGYILREMDSSIVDVVATYGYVFNYAQTGVTSSDWSGSLSGGYAGVSRAISDNNSASDWYVPTSSNPQTIGSLNPGLSQGIGLGCYSERTAATAFVINIPPLGEPEISPDSLSATINSCEDSVSFAVTITNIGDSILDYNTIKAQVEGYDSTSYVQWYSSNYSTTHTFHNLSTIADSIYLSITLAGDFDASNEYAELYIDGQYIGLLDDKDLPASSLIKISLKFGGNDVINWLSDGQITVLLDNSSYVSYGYGTDYHRVQLSIEGPAGWVNVENTSGSIGIGGSANINVHLSSSGLINGSYSSSFPISFNNPGIPTLDVQCDLVVNGQANIGLSTACLNYGDVMQYTSVADSFILTNTGCDTLFIDSLHSGLAAYTFYPNATTLFPQQSEIFYVNFYPQSTGSYNTNLDIYSNISMRSVCLTGNAYSPPQISLVPDSISAQLIACDDSAMVSFSIENIGDTTLTYQVLGGRETSVAPSCTPLTTGYCCGMGITRVTFNTIDNATAPGSDNYQNYSSTQRTQVLAGEVYPIYVQTGTQYREHVRVWIDFDNSGTFESSEKLMESVNVLTNHYGFVSIPFYTVTNTPLTMRVMSEYYSYSLPEACSNVVYGQCEDYSVIIQNGAYFNSQNGNLAPGGSTSVDVWIKAEGFYSGVYDGGIFISSNDPINPIVSVKTHLDVIGAPEIDVQATSLHFDSLMIGAVQSISTLVSNTGCSTLVVSAISSSSGSFSFSPLSLQIAPGDSAMLDISFSPLTTGSINGSISLQSNAGNINISVDGWGLPAPNIVVTPDSLVVTITTCNDSTIRYLNVTNTGTAELRYSVESMTGQVTLDSALGRINSSYGSITSLIPNIHYFTEGVSGNNISDGQYDMYDNGNYINTNLQSSIYYSDNTVLASASFGPSGKYFTRKVDGLWVFAADIDSISYFEISGNLGADGNGLADTSVLQTNIHGITYQGFVKRVYSAGDPSINHLIIVPKNPGLSQSYSANTGYEAHRITGLESTSRIYYLLYSSLSGGYIPDSTALKIMQRFLGIMNSSTPYLELNPLKDTIGVSGSSQIAATFYSEGLANGIFNTNIHITSNDPDDPEIKVPVKLIINGLPQIRYSPGVLSFGNTMMGTGASLSLWIFNDGCGILSSDSIWTSLPQNFIPSHTTFNIPANDSLKLTINFAPSAIGLVNSQLNLQTNIGTYVISLSGVGVPEPIISTNPTAFNATIASCDDSVTYPLWIYNTGMGDLIYQVSGGASLYYDQSSMIGFNTNSAYTAHTFYNIPANADSLFVTVTLNGDYDGGSEYASLYIDGQNIGIIPDGNLYGTDIIVTYAFSYAEFINWASDGNIVVGIQNTSAVDPFSGLGNYHKVNVKVDAAPWLDLTLLSDTVTNGDSSFVNVNFSSSGILSGTYHSTILVYSNDPYNPLVTIPCTLNVAGDPVFSASDTCLFYGTVLVGNHVKDTLTIFNSGCDSLIISNITVSDSDFTVLSAPSYVLPNTQAMLELVFNPARVGIYDEILALQTNIGNYQICLNGIGAAPPVLAFSPGTLSADIYACDDTVALPLYVSNAGVEDLIFELTGNATDSINILAYQYATNASIQASVINALNQKFTQYYLSTTSTTSALTLANELIGKDVLLFTRYSLNASSVFANFSSVLHDFVNQGGTVIFAGIYDATYSQNMYSTGLLSGTYNTYYSSGFINIDNTDPLSTGLTTTIPISSYVFLHNFTNPDLVRIGTYGTTDAISYREIGNGKVIYLGYDFYTYVDQAAIILGRAIEASSRGGLPKWLRISPTIDTVVSGDTSIVQVVFDPVNELSGTYSSKIIIRTNVPGSSYDSVLCTLNLYGNAIADLPGSCVDLGSVKVGGSLAGAFSFNNTGCDDLIITSISNDDPEMIINFSPTTIAAGSGSTVNIQFQALTTGLHIDTVRLVSNIGILKVCISAFAESAPELGVNPSFLTASINGCSDSTSQTVRISNNGNAALNWTVPAQNATDYALSFDGYDDYVNLGTWNAAAIWTLETWVKPASQATGRKTILGGVQGCADWAITVQDGMFALQIKPNNGLCSYTKVSSVAAVPGIWYHVAAVNTGIQARLYVNGQLAASTNVSPYYLGTASGVRIGGEYCCWGNNFHGIIDEVRVWNVARSEAQIRSNMFNALSGTESGLQGYWPFDEGSGNIVNDNTTVPTNGNIYGPIWNTSTKPVNWLKAIPSSGTVAALDSMDIEVTFYSTDLYNGIFTQDLIIETDDPVHPKVEIPCTLTIIGEADIFFSESCLAFGSVMQYAQQSMVLQITNTGCDTLEISALSTTNSSFSVNNTSVSILPSNSASISVIYSPLTSGSHSGDLTIVSNIGTHTVCLSGIGSERPVALLSNDTILGQPACSFTDTASILMHNQGNAALVLSYAISPAVSWGNLIESPSIVSPLSQENISFAFDKTGLAQGSYFTTLTIQTNDPLNPTLSVKIVLEIPNILATVNLGYDTGTCVGMTINIGTANTFSSYLWNTGATTPTIGVSSSGTYYITATDNYGCTSTDDIYVGFYNYPVALAGSDINSCETYNIDIEGSASGLIPAQSIDIVAGSPGNFTNSTVPVPFKTYYMDGKTQLIYSKDELNSLGFTSGPIEQLGFNVNSPGSPAMNNFSIHIGASTANTLSSFVSGLIPCFDTLTYQAVVGWNMFKLQTPYYWSGNDNLVIEICFNNNSYSSNASMEYTQVLNSVWGAYCDNCEAGCNLTGGSGSSLRANLRLLAKNDRTKYSWTGPNGYQSADRTLDLNNINQSMAGTYTLSVDNGWGCTDTDDMLLSVLPTPMVNAGANDTIIEGDTLTLNASVTGSDSPYSYVWTPSANLSNPNILNPLASPQLNTVYSILVSGNNGCSANDEISITVIPIHTLSGTLTYDNNIHSSLSGVKIFANKPGESIIDSTITSQNGYYSFDLEEGSYQLSFDISKLWGGANATDALEIARHSVFYVQLADLKLSAGDVNLSGKVNATDALLVMRRFVGDISTFAAGDWIFGNPGIFEVNTDLAKNVKAINTGDVDGSNIPGKSAPDYVKLSYADAGASSDGQQVDIPVFIKDATEVAALSMEIILPEIVERIEDIVSPLNGLIYSQKGNILRIAWQDPIAYYFRQDEILFTLHCILKGEVQGTSRIQLGMGNEFADANAGIVRSVELYTQAIINGKDGPGLGQNFPDPFNRITYIPYSLNAAAEINLSLIDILGRTVDVLYEGRAEKGNHLLTYDGSHLTPGTYFYQIKTSGENPYSATYKMIISR